jgi:hypothetical protein
MFLVKSVLLAFLVVGLLAACGRERTVSFKRDVMPILKENCLQCHSGSGQGANQSGLRMDNYEDLMKGTKHGPVVVPGSSLNSVFNQVVEGRVDKSIAMPHGGQSLSEEDIKTLKTWVDQGAKNN